MMKAEIKVGQVWRDTYDDDARRGIIGKRTIRVTEILGDTVKADVATDQHGSQPQKPRTTTMFSMIDWAR